MTGSSAKSDERAWVGSATSSGASPNRDIGDELGCLQQDEEAALSVPVQVVRVAAIGLTRENLGR